MKKLLYLSLFLICSKSLCAVDVTSNQAYTISTAASTDKSLFVKNASLDRDTEIVLWTETNVPAQQWVFLKNSDDTYTITNAYSGKILYRKGNATEGAVVSQDDNTMASSAAGKWSLIPVEGQEGHFHIVHLDRNGELNLYLETTSLNDGASILLGSKKEDVDAQKQIWKLDAAEGAIGFSQFIRDEMMSGWKAKYYRSAGTGSVLGNGGWWGDAEMFEVVLDAYETTGSSEHETMFRELYQNFVARNRTNWLYNEYNDDIAWMVIVSIRAYLMFGDNNYLTNAKTNFDQMYARALLPSGMLRWKESAETKNGTNSCINGPAEVAACYLGMALNDESYYQKAKDLYTLQRKYLYVPSTGQVYDSFSWVNDVPSNYNHWASTYNQGTFLGAALMLYNYYGDKQYKEDAETIIKYTYEHLCDENGIIKVCQVGSGDLAGFKGILMRYIRRFIVDLQKSEYVSWMQKNALHVYNNRNSAGVTSAAWLSKTPENFRLENCSDNCSFQNDPFGPSTAVSAVFNAPLDENKIVKNAFANIEAENFDYLKGVHVQTGTGGNVYEIGNVKDGFWIAYNNIDFGLNLASSIEMRLSKSTLSRGSEIEIRLGSITGDSIGTITVPKEGDEWQVVSQEIIPVGGMQNIYFLFKGITGQNNLYKVDYFRFKTDTYMFSDVTDNGGVITSSADVSSLNNVIDNLLNTDITMQVTGDDWLLYQSPVAVRLNGYALASANGQTEKRPESWKLQGSNNGSTWTDLDVRSEQSFGGAYQKKSYDVSADESYTLFRLYFPAGGASEIQLAEWQLFGSSIFEDDITSDGGSLTVQNNQSGLWLDYNANGIYKLQSYSITSSEDAPESDPKNWILYASADSKSWTKIDEQINQLFNYRNTTQYYFPKVEEGYQYYKLHATANNGGSTTQIAEWQMFGDLYYDQLYNDITANRGQLSASGDANSRELRFLNDNDGNTAYSLNAAMVPTWIQYQSTVPARVLAYSIVAGYESDKNPRNWTLQGSDDGLQWADIHPRSNITFAQKGERKTYPVSSTRKFNYFRLNITRLSDSSADEVIIGEWEIHGTGITPTDIISNNDGITSEFPGVNTNESISRLVDKSENTKYCVRFYGSAWVSYESPTPVKLNTYSITSANDDEKRDPRSWVLEASNNGMNWETIDSRSKIQFPYRGLTQYFACNKEMKEYTHFRLNIIENNGSELMQMAEWQLLNIDVEEDNPSKLFVQEADPDINYYLNPVSNELHIDVPEKAWMRIYNIFGQIYYSQQLNAGQQSISLANCETGIYLMSIQIRDKTINKKLRIKN